MAAVNLFFHILVTTSNKSVVLVLKHKCSGSAISYILPLTFSDINIRLFLKMADAKTNNPISHDLRDLES